MGMEQRGSVRQVLLNIQLEIEDEILDKTKPFEIPKALVWKGFKLVKANKGSAGIDQESLIDFEQNLTGNLYKLWNRLTSGTYFPPSVKGVAIPKKQGGMRLLGIPTVSDRIAQMTIKLAFEPCVESIFLFEASAVPVKRHIKIKAEATSYDPRFTEYFEKRTRYLKATRTGSKQPVMIK